TLPPCRRCSVHCPFPLPTLPQSPSDEMERSSAMLGEDFCPVNYDAAIVQCRLLEEGLAASN
ncbi:hypothetical protein BDZ89DRAFT_1061195, partial [Hymenopellis radicata]